MMEENCLKKYIDRKGLSLSLFATTSRLSISTIFRITNGRNKPSYRTARRIVAATKKELTLEDFGFAPGIKKRARTPNMSRGDYPGSTDGVAALSDN